MFGHNLQADGKIEARGAPGTPEPCGGVPVSPLRSVPGADVQYPHVGSRQLPVSSALTVNGAVFGGPFGCL